MFFYPPGAQETAALASSLISVQAFNLAICESPTLFSVFNVQQSFSTTVLPSASTTAPVLTVSLGGPANDPLQGERNRSE